MHPRIKFIGLVSILSLSSLGASTPETLYTIAPTRIEGVDRMMKTAGFWISRHSDPDGLIMDAVTIESFNERVRGQLTINDLRRIPNPTNGNKIREMIESQIEMLRSQVLYDVKGKEVDEKFFDRLHRNMDLDSLLEQKDLVYAFVTSFADQRLLPTEDGLYAKMHDIDFDELQNSGLDVGTPVLIFHESKDKKWAYVISEISSGWVREEQIADASASEFQSFLGAQSFAVITAPKADLYLDEGMTQFHDHARMGMKFPLLNDDEQAATIMIPRRTEKGTMESVTAYVDSAQVASGFLPYTARTIFEQAFKLLNEPYGWGDAHGEQDCSRFLQEVFATVGIILPRDSKNQAKVGQLLADFGDQKAPNKKIANLKKISGGAVILTMKGHIMLYLGMIEGKPYAIHSVWAYRQPQKKEGDLIRVLNRVTLSDLFLGEGSKKGSLIQRMNGIVAVKN